MKLKFSIHYRTEWGQQLQISLKCQAADGTIRTHEVPMTTQDGDYWQVETSLVESRRSALEALTYIYKVVGTDGSEIRREWELVPRTYSIDVSKTYTFVDIWRDRPLPFHLYSNAYAVTAGRGRNENVEPLRFPLFRKTLLFRVSAPQLSVGQCLALVGSHPSMGSWSPARYLPMEYVGQYEWMLTLNADVLNEHVEYKFVVVDKATHQLLSWEEGDNRVVEEMPADGEVRVAYGDALRVSEKTWRAAGVCVPVFSLRSEKSYGVGDFGDLYRFVDWASVVGMKMIQLLPLNDTTNSCQWGDSYPYNIVSAFALHPHYIDLEQLGVLNNKQKMTAFHRRRRELNSLEYSDYEAVDRVKSEYVAMFYTEQGEQTVASASFKEWVEANSQWLVPYAKWMTENALTHWALESYGIQDAEMFVFFIQYHLDLQLKRAADYARSKHIVLKGDLPIGVDAHSVETSIHPEFFHLDGQAGAPPDVFSLQGQNWGFPTYCWDDSRRKDLLTWMKQRLTGMEQYFDALRIDHVLGFFRIWEIPADQLFGTMGHFCPSLPLTAGEIEYYGLPFRRDFLTRPFINEKVIERFFGIHATFVRENYLVRKSYGLYELKPEVDTQLKVKQLFEGRNDENSIWIRDGLYRLVANVLFLEDTHHPDMYHPRIAASQEPVFEALPSDERDAYMRLYNNYFYERHSMFWGQTGYARLSEVFSKTRMLVCAEDLGMLPDCVAPVLDSLGILTLEIQQMPKLKGEEFAHLENNPIRSVATISTHDMAPLRLWWQENPERAQRFFSTMLQKQGRTPEQLPAHLAEEIIARHLYSPSMLCILSLQDWLAMDGELRSKNVRAERINVPSNPYNHWQWRMHLTIDQLIEASRYNEKLKTMITRSKR